VLAGIGHAVDRAFDDELPLVQVQPYDVQVAARERDVAALRLEVHFFLVEVVYVLHAGDHRALPVVDVDGMRLDGLDDLSLFHMHQLPREYGNKYDGIIDYMLRVVSIRKENDMALLMFCYKLINHLYSFVILLIVLIKEEQGNVV
jgi:hypothetical protein